MYRGLGRRSISLVESVLSNYGVVYTFLLLYAFTNILLFISYAVPESRLHDDIERYTTTIARGSGAMINFNVALVLLLASRMVIGFLRETPLTLVFPLDKAMPDFHKVVGMILIISGLVHSICHCITYSAKFVWSKGFTGRTSLFASGIVLLLLMITIRLSARSSVYHASYETFIRLHVGGTFFMYIALMIHGLHRGTPSSWKWVLGPIIIYVLDRGLRYFREKRSYLLVSKHSAVFQGPDILKIRLPRVFHFQAGQYAEVKVPSLSRFQWHPFTIASAPHEPEMVFYIKAIGDWTTSLYHLFRENAASQNSRDMEVHIRGPYGASSQHVGQFDRIILIGGGVGATPFCSVVKDAYNWITNWAPHSKQNRRKTVNNAARNSRRPSKRVEPPTHVIPQPLKRSRAVRQHDGVTINGERGSASTQSQENSSHIFTTNIFTDNFDSFTGDEANSPKKAETDEFHDQQPNTKHQTHTRNNTVSHRSGETDDSRIMMTARETISDRKSRPATSTQTSTVANTAPDPVEQISTSSTAVNVGNIFFNTEKRNQGTNHLPHRMRSNIRTRAHQEAVYEDDMRMGTFHETVTGTYRRSLDFLSALHSAYAEDETNEIFHKSIDLMVGMSFGSVSLVRSLQIRKTQQKMREGPNLTSNPRGEYEDISILQKPRIVLLLFLRSVTVTMSLLWILLLRFIIAVTASIFGALPVFQPGITLYNVRWLIVVDMVLVSLLVILIGLPSIVEILELGAAPIHGFDFFVLTPLVTLELAVHIISLVGIGDDLNLFGVIHVFVFWPLLFIFLMIRLLRIIGERISQADNLTVTHSTTKTVDFYWTAPSPEDDQWLVNELSSYTDNPAVQIHRYLTRCTQNDIDLRETRIRKEAKHLHTNYGRPDWITILNEFSERCPNNTTVGVFFCGPHSMGEAVQDACFSAMRNSIVRGLQSGARAMRGLEEVFGDAVSANEYTGEFLTRSEVTARGCNVKFIFRRETFL